MKKTNFHWDSVACCAALQLLGCFCSEFCCFYEERRQRREMNYAYLLQTIIPGSPWRRRTTTATPTTSMPVQSWVLFVCFSAALLNSVASEAPFSCAGSTFITLWVRVPHNFSLIRVQPSLFLFFFLKLCSLLWRLQLLMNHKAPSAAFKMAAAPSARRELCVIFS